MAVTYQNGRYLGRVTDQLLGKSSKKGTPEIQIRFAILGIVDPADPEGQLISCPPGERTVYLYITANTHEYVVRDLQRLGFTGDSFSKIDPNVNGFCDLSGAEAEFECRSETYDGEEREKWSVARDSALRSTPIDDKDVLKLDALYGSQLKANARAAQEAKPEQPVGTPVETANETPVQATDDIPF